MGLQFVGAAPGVSLVPGGVPPQASTTAGAASASLSGTAQLVGTQAAPAGASPASGTALPTLGTGQLAAAPPATPQALALTQVLAAPPPAAQAPGPTNAPSTAVVVGSGNTTTLASLLANQTAIQQLVQPLYAAVGTSGVPTTARPSMSRAPSPPPCKTDLLNYLRSGQDTTLFLSLGLLTGWLQRNLSAPTLAGTLLLPTDTAISDFLTAQGISPDDLVSSADQLESVLAYHWLPKPLTYADLARSPPGALLPTGLPGSFLAVLPLNATALQLVGAASSADIVRANILVCTTVVHFIDAVLQPAPRLDQAIANLSGINLTDPTLSNTTVFAIADPALQLVLGQSAQTVLGPLRSMNGQAVPSVDPTWNVIVSVRPNTTDPQAPPLVYVRAADASLVGIWVRSSGASDAGQAVITRGDLGMAGLNLSDPGFSNFTLFAPLDAAIQRSIAKDELSRVPGGQIPNAQANGRVVAALISFVLVPEHLTLEQLRAMGNNTELPTLLEGQDLRSPPQVEISGGRVVLGDICIADGSILHIIDAVPVPSNLSQLDLAPQAEPYISSAPAGTGSPPMAALPAQERTPPAAVAPGGCAPSLAAAVASNPQLTILQTALGIASFDLSDPALANVTLFAPLDAALLTVAARGQLLQARAAQNSRVVAALISFFLVPEELTLEQLRAMGNNTELPTLLEAPPQVVIGGGRIVQGDICIADGSILHIIDAVPVPSNLSRLELAPQAAAASAAAAPAGLPPTAAAPTGPQLPPPGAAGQPLPAAAAPAQERAPPAAPAQSPMLVQAADNSNNLTQLLSSSMSCLPIGQFYSTAPEFQSLYKLVAGANLLGNNLMLTVHRPPGGAIQLQGTGTNASVLYGDIPVCEVPVGFSIEPLLRQLARQGAPPQADVPPLAPTLGGVSPALEAATPAREVPLPPAPAPAPESPPAPPIPQQQPQQARAASSTLGFSVAPLLQQLANSSARAPAAITGHRAAPAPELTSAATNTPAAAAPAAEAAAPATWWREQQHSCRSVREVLDDAPPLSHWAPLMEAGGLLDNLTSASLPAGLTFLAPTSAAVDALLSVLGPGAQDALLGSPATLLPLLLYHVITPALSLQEIDARTRLETLATDSQGLPLQLRVQHGAGDAVGLDGEQGQAAVLFPDIVACEGVVHVVDAVLLPVPAAGSEADGHPTPVGRPLRMTVALSLLTGRGLRSTAFELLHRTLATTGWLAGPVYHRRLRRLGIKQGQLRRWHVALAVLLGGRLLLAMLRMARRMLWWREVSDTPRRDLEERMQWSSTYEKWAEAALELDKLEGRDCQQIERSFDHELLRRRTSALAELREQGDMFGLMFALRRAQISRFHWRSLRSSCVQKGDVPRSVCCCCLHPPSPLASLRVDYMRHAGSAAHEALLRTGLACPVVPRSVTEYIEEVKRALEFIAGAPDLAIDDKLAFLRELRHAHGRSALVLSGGGSLGFHHFGVMRALSAANLLPRVVSGSSAGSLGGATLCTRTEGELAVLNDAVPDMPGWDFFSNKTQQQILGHMLAKGTAHDYRFFQGRLQALYGARAAGEGGALARAGLAHIQCDMTFAEAYQRTGRILNIAVCAADTREPSRLLNYLTAPNCLIWSAVACSSAFPLLFSPMDLLAKDANGNVVKWSQQGAALGERRWCDGSLEEDLPMRGLSELFNVTIFITSQCNPYLLLIMRWMRLLPTKLARLIDCLQSSPTSGSQSCSLRRVRLPHGLECGACTSCAPTRDSQQRFTMAPLHEQAMREGQCAVWRKLPAIQAACAVEVAIDETLQHVTRQAQAQRRLEKAALHRRAQLASPLMRRSLPSWLHMPSLGLPPSESWDELGAAGLTPALSHGSIAQALAHNGHSQAQAQQQQAQLLVPGSPRAPSSPRTRVVARAARPSSRLALGSSNEGSREGSQHGGVAALGGLQSVELGVTGAVAEEAAAEEAAAEEEAAEATEPAEARAARSEASTQATQAGAAQPAAGPPTAPPLIDLDCAALPEGELAAAGIEATAEALAELEEEQDLAEGVGARLESGPAAWADLVLLSGCGFGMDVADY
eukprot:scaffold17.g538.t1